MEKYIKVTKAELERRFNQYNDLYFDGQLPQPKRFELWTCSKKCVGWVRGYWNKWGAKYETFFHINARCYNWTDENLKSVMLHEMIHMAIKDYLRPVRWWQWIFPPKQHDSEFIEYMNSLNEKYGLNITVKAKFMREHKKVK